MDVGFGQSCMCVYVCSKQNRINRQTPSTLGAGARSLHDSFGVSDAVPSYLHPLLAVSVGKSMG